MSGTINIGRVRPIYKGNYNAETAYSVLERVKYKGHIYECVANTTPGIAPDSADNGSAYWIQISVNNAIPQPVWTGTELAFEYPDGTITDAVDLIGPQGPQGVPGPVNLTSDLTSTAADVALTALGGNTLATRIALLQTKAEQGLGLNTKEIIKESGEWTAPVTGTYKVTLISGGYGAVIINETSFVNYTTGYSGSIIQKFKYLTEGQLINVVIGSAGIGNPNYKGAAISGTAHIGGNTIFDDITAFANVLQTDWNGFVGTSLIVNKPALTQEGGAGAGAGTGNTSDTINGRFYGAGGGVYIDSANNQYLAGNGHDGCVIVEWFDSEKASLPTINDTDLITYINLLQRLEAIESQLNINS